MFRQQQPINCNCSLFPQTPIPKLVPFRSPQRYNPHKENRSKKSLKCHSSSRQKGFQKLSYKQAQIDTVMSSKIQTQTLSSKHSQIFKPPNNNFHRHSENYQGYYSKANDHLKQKHRKAFDMMKNSNQSILQNHISTRATSPLNPCDTNAQRKVIFNYKIQQAASTQMYAISPHPQKISQNTGQNTMTTTLVGSIIPNSDIRKKHLQQRSVWSKESFNQFTLPEPNQMQSYQNYISIQSPSIQKEDYAKRPRTSSNIFMLSRLTEIMNDKSETQSIYEGQKTHEQGGVQYSRVLVSFKKLMQDNKTGVIQQVVQTKIFDYDEKAKDAIVKNSNMFGQIKIDRK